jgi:ABC-type microcin C transport system permease subunit YejE
VIRETPYIDAARALGFGHLRIILKHMVPNVMAPFLIMVTAFVGQAILAEASLSYLGLGVQEPVPAWGLMLQGGAEEFQRPLRGSRSFRASPSCCRSWVSIYWVTLCEIASTPSCER